MLKGEIPSQAGFQAKLFSVVEQLRGALIELLSAIEIDPAVPYAVSRRLVINKNMAWKVCRIIATQDPYKVIEHLPGPQGMEIFLLAAASHGAPPAALAAVRGALADFANLVETHAGNRRALGLMLASHHDAPQEPIEESRRLAYEGNSAIWGLQARVRLVSHFVAPSPGGDGMIDCAVVGGLVDLRRLRPNVGAPVFLMQAYNDDGTPRGPHREALDGAAASSDDSSMLIRRFCSADAPPLERQHLPDATRFELPRGPVGKTAVATWVYGWRTPRLASRFRDEINRFGEHATRVFLPVETLQCDLYVHESLPFATQVRAVLYSQLAGGPYAGPRRPCDELPLREQVTALGGRPPVVATPLLPRYAEWMRWAFEKLDWDAREFAAFRFVMKYPPIPTVLVLRYTLPERPGASENLIV
jgi:hypothetical protein